MEHDIILCNLEKKKPWKHFMLLIDNYVCSKEQEYEIYTPTSIYLLTL